MRQKSILLDQQQAFVDALSAGFSVAASSKEAGFSQATGYKLLNVAEVQAKLDAARYDLREVSGLRRVDMAAVALEAIDMARTLSDPQAMLAGVKILNDMLGYKEPDKLEVALTVSENRVQARLQQMSDAELHRIMRGDYTPLESDVIDAEEVPNG
ncbi:MAG: hypothetical protein LBC97_15815 [Bifidobacteriaceae bacterium]|jgi:hypothetical protein|nr:hypothetical protein [Bifidobacteriaceae bacterium]